MRFGYNLVMSSWVGQTLGKVHIDTLLARGGMAEVYIGTHKTLQREVAVKILRNNYEEQPHALERFQREAMVVGKLRHPNIVQVFDFDTTSDSQPYLVMEFIKGPSLLKYLNALHAKKELMEFSHVVRLMDAMTSALQYAHDNGVVHRDIKPGNILLTSRSSEIVPGKPLPDDFEPVLTDFGLVRFIDSMEHTTGSGQIAGTPAYMSPEQARGELTDGRTDVYSLGIVLYEILAGHLPFQGETTMGVLMKHISEPPAPISGLPPKMQLVLDRALAKDVNDRFQTPYEFAEAFSGAVENQGDFSTLEFGDRQAPRKTKPRPKPAKRLFGPQPKRQFTAPILAAVVVLAVAASLLFNVLPSRSSNLTEASVTAVPASFTPQQTPTVPTRTRTPKPFLSDTLGVLQFQNASAFADQALLIAEALLAPPEENQYEVWLVGGKERISLGILTLDATGKGELKFKLESAANLISLYNRVEVTIEPKPDTNPQSSNIVAYSFTFPEEGLNHVRYVLCSYPDTPAQEGLIRGLYDDIALINEFAKEMQKASLNGNEDRVKLNAEAMQNIIAGSQSPDYRDHNGDQQIDDPSDGYGLMLNGRNLGYLRAIYIEADTVLKSANASQPMLNYAPGLKNSVDNLAQWTAEMQTLLSEILSAPQGTDTKQQVAEAVTLAEKMLNGADLDESGTVDAVPGEGGVQVAYDQAYHMADMPLLSVGVLNTGTGTGTPSFLLVTPTSGGGNGTGGSGDTVPTARPRNTPPRGNNNTPKPTNDNNGGGGGGGNGGGNNGGGNSGGNNASP